MTNRVYEVARHLVVLDSCYVEASSQKEAIAKAQSHDCVKVVVGESANNVPLVHSDSWEMGDVVTTHSYVATRSDCKKCEDDEL